MNVMIREMCGLDLTEAFLETLASLAEVDLTLDEAAEIFRQRLRCGVHTYIALVSGKVAGTVSLVVEQKFIHHGGRVGHIEDVAVHRDFQKQGIGQALVRHATHEAERFGCYKVILNCFERLVPFYKDLGYQPYDVGMRQDLSGDAAEWKSASSVIPTAATASSPASSTYSCNGK
jgi:glucosamine-phosphate N-acetyltransferase